VAFPRSELQRPRHDSRALRVDAASKHLTGRREGEKEEETEGMGMRGGRAETKASVEIVR
jgi:hypothetical protein